MGRLKDYYMNKLRNKAYKFIEQPLEAGILNIQLYHVGFYDKRKKNNVWIYIYSELSKEEIKTLFIEFGYDDVAVYLVATPSDIGYIRNN